MDGWPSQHIPAVSLPLSQWAITPSLHSSVSVSLSLQPHCILSLCPCFCTLSLSVWWLLSPTLTEGSLCTLLHTHIHMFVFCSFKFIWETLDCILQQIQAKQDKQICYWLARWEIASFVGHVVFGHSSIIKSWCTTPPPKKSSLIHYFHSLTQLEAFITYWTHKSINLTSSGHHSSTLSNNFLFSSSVHTRT